MCPQGDQPFEFISCLKHILSEKIFFLRWSDIETHDSRLTYWLMRWANGIDSYWLLQICHTKSGEINPMKIKEMVKGYVKKFRYLKKKVGPP